MADVSYKEFIEAVIKLIHGFDMDDYRNYILNVAKNANSKERMDLIRSLESISGCDEEIVEELVLEDDSLISEIQELADRIDNSEYSYGYGWDTNYGGEREMGDESWAEEVDYFFKRAESKVREGNYKVAGKAYEMIFEILESENLPCYESPKEMLKIELEEQIGLYLRSIYMTTETENKAKEIYESIKRYFYLECNNVVKLKNMFEAEISNLPQVDIFLYDWIELLINKDEPFVSNLVREAVILKDGIEGIRMFAREYYERFPAAYRDWAEELEKTHAEAGEIITVAREGLSKINKDYLIREEIAKYLIKQGNKINSYEVVAEGMKEAIYSNPSLKRVLEFIKLEKDKNKGVNSVLNFAIERQEQLKLMGEASYWKGKDELEKTRYSRSLLNQLFLLSSNIEKAYELCSESTFILKGYKKEPEELILAFTLRLLSKNSPSFCSNNNILWKKNMEAIKNEFYSTDIGKLFEDELNLAIHNIKLSSDDEKKYSHWCIELVSSTADYIVSNQNRDQYYNAALFLVCCKEMLLNMKLEERGIDLINSFKNKYPRHRNFISSLRQTLSYSGLD